VHEPFGHGQPESDARSVPGVVAQALERQEDAFSLRGGDPRSGVDDAEVQLSASAAASTRIGLSSGEKDIALSIRLATARSSKVGSTQTRGNVSGPDRTGHEHSDHHRHRAIVRTEGHDAGVPTPLRP
jgi:hypothetical protein